MSMKAQAEDIMDLWLLARRTAAILERRAEAALQAELGLPLSLYALLSTLDAHDCDVNQQETADLLGLTKSSVSRQVEAAVAAGLLEQTLRPGSRREKVQQFTPEGRDVLDRAYGILASIAPDSAPEQHAATASLAALLGRIDD